MSSPAKQAVSTILSSDKRKEITDRYIKDVGPAGTIIDSYNVAIEKFKDLVNGTVINLEPYARDKLRGDFYLSFKDTKILNPTTTSSNNIQVPFYPATARNEEKDYASRVNTSLCFYQRSEEKKEGKEYLEDKEIASVELECGTIPTMLRSNCCNLKGLSYQELIERGEDPDDTFGYFVLQGSEKSIVMQERTAINKIISYEEPKSADKETVTEIKVISNDGYRIRIGVRKSLRDDHVLNASTKKKPIQPFIKLILSCFDNAEINFCAVYAVLDCYDALLHVNKAEYTNNSYTLDFDDEPRRFNVSVVEKYSNPQYIRDSILKWFDNPEDRDKVREKLISSLTDYSDLVLSAEKGGMSPINKAISYIREKIENLHKMAEIQTEPTPKGPKKRVVDYSKEIKKKDDYYRKGKTHWEIVDSVMSQLFPNLRDPSINSLDKVEYFTAQENNPDITDEQRKRISDIIDNEIRLVKFRAESLSFLIARYLSVVTGIRSNIINREITSLRDLTEEERRHFSHDDRDDYTNKLIDNPGMLMMYLIGNVWKKMRGNIEKRLKAHFDSFKQPDNGSLEVIANGVLESIRNVSQFSEDFSKAVRTGTWGPANNGKTPHTGITRALQRASRIGTIADIRSVVASVSKQSKDESVRSVHWTYWGFICPTSTKEGGDCGLTKSLSIGCKVTNGCDQHLVVDLLNYITPTSEEEKFNDLDITEDYVHQDLNTPLFINGGFRGWVQGANFVNKIRTLRSRQHSLSGEEQKSILPYDVSVFYNTDGAVEVLTSPGRPIRPVLCVSRSDNKNVLDIDHYNAWNFSWKQLEQNGLVDYIDVNEQNNLFICEDYDKLNTPVVKNVPYGDETTQEAEEIPYYHYCELHPTVLFSYEANITPFAGMNPGARITYSGNMGKHAVGIYHTGHRERMEASKVIAYVQNPIVTTSIYHQNNEGMRLTPEQRVTLLNQPRYANLTEEEKDAVVEEVNTRLVKLTSNNLVARTGLNVNLMILSGGPGAFNEEDSMMLAKGFVERGGFMSIISNIETFYLTSGGQPSESLEYGVPPYLPLERLAYYSAILHPEKTDAMDEAKSEEEAANKEIYKSEFAGLPYKNAQLRKGMVILARYYKKEVNGDEKIIIGSKNLVDETEKLSVLIGDKNAYYPPKDYNYRQYYIREGTKYYLITDDSQTLRKTDSTVPNNLPVTFRKLYLGLYKYVPENLQPHYAHIRGGFTAAIGKVIPSGMAMVARHLREEVDRNTEIEVEIENGDKMTITLENLLPEIGDAYTIGDSKNYFVHSTEDGQDIFYKIIDKSFYSTDKKNTLTIEMMEIAPSLGLKNSEIRRYHKEFLYATHAGLSARVQGIPTVQKVTINRDRSNRLVCTIKYSMIRTPKVGDKFASRYSQKGTTGAIIADEDLPFTDSGMKPDIIINPHAFPSRMTIGQIAESIVSSIGAQEGETFDASEGVSILYDKLVSYLDQNIKNTRASDGTINFHEPLKADGTVTVYDGIDGMPYENPVFMGFVYYQLLKHFAEDKKHGRATGDMHPLTRQPPEGKSKDGGLRLGEMERDAFIVHGARNWLHQGFNTASDPVKIPYCSCGNPCIIIPDNGSTSCSSCAADINSNRHKTSEIKVVDTVYSLNVLSEYSKASCIRMKCSVAPNKP